MRYEGVPEIDRRPALGPAGCFHTDDGMLIVGQPDVAAAWFPVNDHPLDKASYTIKVDSARRASRPSPTVTCKRKKTKHGMTTFVWQEQDPMASYLATATVGKFDITDYRKDGIRFYDAIDPALFEPVAAPTTGTQLAISGQADSSYKRLTRTIAVPAGGATLSFWITRDTEPSWDFVFVEAHTVGAEDWTTLPDANGHTSADTGISCPLRLAGAPPVPRPLPDRQRRRHVHADRDDGRLVGRSGPSDGPPSNGRSTSRAYAGKSVEVSIAYASDDVVQAHGVFVDDISTSTGEGSTSFEADGDTLDGWTVPGAPAGSPGNENDWTVGTAADLPRRSAPGRADVVRARARDPATSCPSKFGPYPFRDAGGIVDRPPGRRVRAREPDAPDLRAGVLLRPDRRATASSSTSSRTSGTATASPSAGGRTSG